MADMSYKGVGDTVGMAQKSATDAVSQAMKDAQANPDDTTKLINLQMKMQQWSVAVNLQSSVVKTLGDGLKSITQKM